jgi:CRP/FNR family transcriptional regulator
MNVAAFLKNARLFAGLPDADIGTFASLARVENTPSKTLLFTEGESCDRFYVVASGRVKVFKESEKGREQILHIVHPGQSFAEAAMFAGTGRFPASAETLEDSALIVLPADQFIGCLRQDSELCLRLLSSVTLWLRRMVDLVEDLALKDVQMRLGGFLVREAEERNLPVKEGTEIPLSMSKSDLARRLGTAAETLSRALYKLQKDGAVRVKGRLVTVADPKKLQMAAQGLENTPEY